MVHEFKLPDVGEGVAEGEIVAWLVEVGEAVKEDQPVAEVETDKALVEVPAPVTGTVRELRAEAGDVVPVGEVFITFDVEGEADAVEGSDTDQTDTGTESGGGQVADDGPAGRVFAAPSVRRLARELGVDLGTVEGTGPGGRVTEGDVRDVAESEAPIEADRSSEMAGAPESSDEGDSRIVEGGSATRGGTAAATRERTLAAPATRRLAGELGVDLDAVPTTEQRDGEAFVDAAAVRAFAAADGEAATAGVDQAVSPTDAAPIGGEERVPYRGIRRAIGQQMERSAYTAPHVSHHELIDAKPLVEARQKLKPSAEQRGVRLTYLPFVMRALTATLPEFPTLNAELDESAEEIVLKGYYNIGFAAATDDGLLVPVVENADRKGLLQLASEIEELAERARDRSIAREEMQGGTFTVTNFGAVGGDFGTPIINHPEVAILGLGAIEKRPYVVDDAVVARETLPLSLSFDHRVIDGATAGRFINRLVEYLEDPLLLLLD